MSKRTDRVTQSSALINAANSLGNNASRALLNVSNLYGNMAEVERKDALQKRAEEQEKLNREENNRRFNIQQKRLNEAAKRDQARFELLNKEQENKKKFNKWALTADVSNYDYSPYGLQGKVGEEIGKAKDSLIAQRDELKRQILGQEGSGAFETGLKTSKKYTKADVLNAINERKSNIAKAQYDIRNLTGEERIKAAEELANKVYNPAISEIESNIKAGKYLSNAQRAKALIKSLDPSIVGSINYDYALKIAKEKAGGFKVDDLVRREEKRVAEANKAQMFNLKNEQSAYNKYASSRKNKPYTVKDLEAYRKNLEGIDIGFMDNDNYRTAAGMLLKRRYHPAAIMDVLQSNINRSSTDYTFFNPITDGKPNKDFEKLAKQAEVVSRRLGLNPEGRVYVQKPIGKYNPYTVRSKDLLIKERIGRLSSKYPRLADYVTGNTDIQKQPNIPNVPDNKSFTITKNKPNKSTERIYLYPDNVPNGITKKEIDSQVRERFKELKTIKDKAVLSKNSEKLKELNKYIGYINGSRESFGTNSERFEKFLTAGVPSKLADKAAVSRENLTDKEKLYINKILLNPGTSADNLTDTQQFIISNALAALKRGVPVSKLTKDEQAFIPIMPQLRRYAELNK